MNEFNEEWALKELKYLSSLDIKYYNYNILFIIETLVANLKFISEKKILNIKDYNEVREVFLKIAKKEK